MQVRTEIIKSIGSSPIIGANIKNIIMKTKKATIVIKDNVPKECWYAHLIGIEINAELILENRLLQTYSAATKEGLINSRHYKIK